VAGAAADRHHVDAVVGEILGQQHDAAMLATDVVSMRHKMLENLASKSDAIINLKQDAGGLVDIEFLAQFARLAFGSRYRRTAEILLHLPEHAPPAWREQAEFLAETYLDYRQMENALRVELWQSIGKLPNNPAATEWETMRRHATIDAPMQLIERMAQVHQLFRTLLESSSN
jgi:glutamate-ammonia-ligase adenylyltransferase